MILVWRPAGRQNKSHARAPGKRHGAASGPDFKRGGDGARKQGGQHKSGPRKAGKPGADRKPQNFTSRPSRKKEADPDSPFAKLAALKAELKGDSKSGE